MRTYRLVCIATVFSGAFLLFLVEPMIARMILPVFGGMAAVWIVCLVFFQLALLLGYLYAHALTRWMSARQQALLHTTLLGLSVLLLYKLGSAHSSPLIAGDPTFRLLALLITTIGLPYVLLSATTPLVQAWFARALKDTALSTSPYRLFAWSNSASLLALLAYPAFVERYAGLHTQALSWSAGFIVFACLCLGVLWVRQHYRGQLVDESMIAPAASPIAAPASPSSVQSIWFALAACGSMLLLAVTNELTQDIAPIPLLWIMPLSLYLLTFVICFQGRGWYRRPLVLRLLLLALASMGYYVYESISGAVLFVGVPLFSAGLFIACLFCNGELSRLKPQSGELTRFYLQIALGGAAGAVAVGILAPRLFTGMFELPVSLLFTTVLAAYLTWGEGWVARIVWTSSVAAMLFLVVVDSARNQANSLLTVRSFYGQLRVVESTQIPGNGDRLRTLYNGGVKHGVEFVSPERRLEPTTYYGPQSGAGLALLHCCRGPKRVGVIGLGVGTLASYGNAGDSFTFYEINPQVEYVANTLFNYLRLSKARIHVRTGDARLLLANEPDGHFDVLAVDAFSGDAIPVHLLTTEAFAIYRRRLNRGGIIAFHVSNIYLDLAPVVAELARANGERAVLIRNTAEPEHEITTARWVLVTDNEGFLQAPEISSAAETSAIPEHARLWTDDYSNIFSAFKFQ